MITSINIQVNGNADNLIKILKSMSFVTNVEKNNTNKKNILLTPPKNSNVEPTYLFAKFTDFPELKTLREKTWKNYQ